MATGTNGIATIGELIQHKGLKPPYQQYDPNRCPMASEIVNYMGGVVNGNYQPNQLVRFSDVTKASSGVLFTVTIDNRKTSLFAVNLYFAYRTLVAPGIYEFSTSGKVGDASDTYVGVRDHNTGPFSLNEIYGSSNVLYFTGPKAVNYSYTQIKGSSGTVYAEAGLGTYSGTNSSPEGNNLECITLFANNLIDGDTVSFTLTIT